MMKVRRWECTRGWHGHIWLCHGVTNWNCWKKNKKRREKKSKNEVYLVVKYPWNTRDTVVRVHGMSRCAKTQHRTRTRDTRDPITAGFPVPVPNPNTDETLIVWNLTTSILDHLTCIWTRFLRRFKIWTQICMIVPAAPAILKMVVEHQEVVGWSTLNWFV